MKRHTIIIAEAGVNHNGSMDMARELIREAAKAGADYVKFQTAIASELVAVTAPKADYQKKTTGATESQLEMLQRLLLPLESFKALASACAEEGIRFMSTPFDLISIDTLAPLGMDFWKIPSGEITNLPYLRKIASAGGRVILSTGMSTLDEVGKAVEVLETGGISRSDIFLLHCTTQYPTPMSDVNLLAMRQLETLGCAGVGYSDHTRGTEVAIAAVALGAKVIEKHFTLDRNLPGPDHKASLEPHELRALVMAVRNIEEALGDGEKRITPSESSNRIVARKSIVASTPIKKGDKLTPSNLTCKRPAGGISPMEWDRVVGTGAIRDFRQDEAIEI